jgi:ATP-dependent helicase/nuclease subunit B
VRTTNNIPAKTPRKSSLSRFAEALAKSCRKHLLREKWLLTPSYRVGRQWLDVVARSGQPVVNVRLKTLPALALELAGPSLARDGLQPLSPLGRLVVVGRLLRQQGERHSTESYLGSLPASLAFVQQMAATLRDLRLAGLGPDDLERGQYEATQKGRELIGLLRAYQDALRQRRLADEADVLRRAAAGDFNVDALVLVPEDLELAALERALLGAIPRQQRIDLPVDPPSDRRADEVFRAVGEINEVREVLRRCLANRWPFDQVELLSTDPDLYGGLVYEVTAALRREDAVTFADGIPVRYTRPARALNAWLAWRRAEFPQSSLVAMVQDGLLALPENLSPARLAGVLRSVPISFGRERYLSKLDEFMGGLVRQLTDADAEYRPCVERRLETARALRPLVERLLQTTCDSLLSSAAAFLRDHAHCATELDNNARQVLLERIEEMTALLEADGTASLNEAEWLEMLLSESRVLGLGPRPGCLHVASVWSGGHSGRPHTFIVSLDSGRFPPPGGQDPVLLDGERQSLSEHLATSGQRREQVVQQFARLLARLRGSVTLSYSGRNLADDAETFPSSAILKQLAYENELPPACAFAPTRADGSLNETEWWLWRLCAAAPVREPVTLVGECFPRLGRGLSAAQQRASEAFTAYDGFVPEAGPDLDPARSPDRLFSPRRLETLGACPLRYFYQYALGLELPDELELDSHRWLQPAEFGQFLHEVFHRFLRDGGRLADILRERIEHYREKFPPPNEGVFRRDCRRLERTGCIFLAEEEELRQTCRPIEFEKEISGVPVRLPDGATIHVRGRIDRVDEMAGRLALWDYKTGNPSRFAKTSKDPFAQGRILQHALYIALAEAHYDRPVAQFGYFFPTEKGRGERIIFTPAKLSDAPNVLARLRELIARGAFPATNQPDDCEYCDYRPICRDIEAVTAQSAGKLASPVNNVLQPFRELRPQ